jgi:hypothetical protein
MNSFFILILLLWGYVLLLPATLLMQIYGTSSPYVPILQLSGHQLGALQLSPFLTLLVCGIGTDSTGQWLSPSLPHTFQDAKCTPGPPAIYNWESP